MRGAAAFCVVWFLANGISVAQDNAPKLTLEQLREARAELASPATAGDE